MLNQIEICRRYAVRHGRRLIVDTESSTTSCMPVPFASVFELSNCGCEVVTKLTLPICQSLNAPGVSVHPRTMAGTFLRRAALPAGAIIRVNPSQPRRPEQVVVHWIGGGGNLSFALLSERRLRLSDTFCSVFARSWESIRRSVRENSPYVAIHVRHTDYTTPDYAKQMEAVFGDGASCPILVCSDGRGVLMEAARLAKKYKRRLLRPWTMEGVSHDPTRTDGQPIHESAQRMTPAQVMRYMMDLMRDLYVLSHAATLHALAPAGKKLPTGFGRLTRFLQGDAAIRAAFFRETETFAEPDAAAGEVGAPPEPDAAPLAFSVSHPPCAEQQTSSEQSDGGLADSFTSLGGKPPAQDTAASFASLGGEPPGGVEESGV